MASMGSLCFLWSFPSAVWPRILHGACFSPLFYMFVVIVLMAFSICPFPLQYSCIAWYRISILGPLADPSFHPSFISLGLTQSGVPECLIGNWRKE